MNESVDKINILCRSALANGCEKIRIKTKLHMNLIDPFNPSVNQTFSHY